MERPSVRQITEKLGWFRHPSRSEYDLAIYGAGPAGLSASVYGASEGLKYGCPKNETGAYSPRQIA